MYIVEEIKTFSKQTLIESSIDYIGVTCSNNAWQSLSRFSFPQKCVFSLLNIDTNERIKLNSIEELGKLIANNELLGVEKLQSSYSYKVHRIKKSWYDLSTVIEYVGVAPDKQMGCAEYPYQTIRNVFGTVRCLEEVSDDGAYIKYISGDVFESGSNFISAHIICMLSLGKEQWTYHLEDDYIELFLWKNNFGNSRGFSISYASTIRYRILNRRKFDAIIAKVKMSGGVI